MAKYKVGIIGATGYTGSELVRLLVNHPDVSLELITSESRAGESFSDVHPQFKNICDQKLVSSDQLAEAELDIVFLGLPHGVSMDFVKEYGYNNFKLIDLSGDFRLSTAEVYNQWYPKKHIYPEGFDDVVFGLPELFRDEIKGSNFIANPGCYPTSVTLPLAPLIKNDLIEPNQIVADSKSGVTGAGASASQKTHFPNVYDNFSAYGLKSHRHTPEIQEAVTDFTGQDTEVLFTPHLLPINRGILSTIYTKPKENLSDRDIQSAYQDMYGDEPFVRLLDKGPKVQNVRGSNYCDIYATYDERTNRVIAMGAIDNLVKGAAGQAVQNMNIIAGLEEAKGLQPPPLSP